MIATLRRQFETTILVTTHYLDEAERLCDRVAIMHAGEIVALDAPGALLARLGREILELRVGGDVPAALASLRARGLPVDAAFAVGSTLTLPLREHTSGEAIAVVNELGLASAISARRPTLDDVYLRLTVDRLADAA